MTEHTQTAYAATAENTQQDRIHAQPPHEAEVFDIAHPHDASVSAPQYAMKEKRKAGTYTPLDLLNEYVAMNSEWSLQNGKYVAAIHLEVDPALQQRLTIDEARAKSHAILTHTPSIEDVLTGASMGKLNARKNALEKLLLPFGSGGRTGAEYKVVSGSMHGIPAEAYLEVNPEAIDMRRAAQQHHWSQDELEAMFPAEGLKATAPKKSDRSNRVREESDLLDPTRALRNAFGIIVEQILGHSRDFVATNASAEKIRKAIGALKTTFGSLGVEDKEYALQLTAESSTYQFSVPLDVGAFLRGDASAQAPADAHDAVPMTYRLEVIPNFRPRSHEEMQAIFAAGSTERAKDSTQPWTMKAIRPLGHAPENSR